MSFRDIVIEARYELARNGSDSRVHLDVDGFKCTMSMDDTVDAVCAEYDAFQSARKNRSNKMSDKPEATPENTKTIFFSDSIGVNTSVPTVTPEHEQALREELKDATPEFKADILNLGLEALSVASVQGFSLFSNIDTPAFSFVIDKEVPPEVLRIDKKGMTYRGEVIEDAGQAHKAFIETMEMMPYPTELRHLRAFRAAANRLTELRKRIDYKAEDVTAAINARKEADDALIEFYKDHPDAI